MAATRIRTFRVLSALLSYPTAELQSAAEDMRMALILDALVPAAIRGRVLALIAEIGDGDLYELQERYTLLFDRTRSLSLHLFEHVHGESRDRGQAMVDLRRLYEAQGLSATPGELPDFIPLFLEFLAMQPLAEACALLAEPGHILAALAERLHRRGSSYECVFRALSALAASRPNRAHVAALLALPDSDAADLAALDAAWEEAAVTFGPGQGDACKDGLIARLRAARRPAPTGSAGS